MKDDIVDCWLKAALILAGAGWLCYRLWWVLLPALPLLARYFREEKHQKRYAAVQSEFKDVMRLLYSSAASGSTLEKTLRDTAADMAADAMRYPCLLPEFTKLCRRLDRNVPISDALSQMSGHIGDEDIRHFVQILIIASKSGGSLPDIIHRTSETMALKIAANEEIETILAGKKGEFMVMLIVPAGILFYMTLTSPAYMQVLYEGITGRLIMTAVLVIYVAAALIGRKILNIRI